MQEHKQEVVKVVFLVKYSGNLPRVSVHLKCIQVTVSSLTSSTSCIEDVGAFALSIAIKTEHNLDQVQVASRT